MLLCSVSNVGFPVCVAIQIDWALRCWSISLSATGIYRGICRVGTHAGNPQGDERVSYSQEGERAGRIEENYDCG
jgi:hypothetical protein